MNGKLDFYGKKNLWKVILLGFAFLIGGTTLWYTESFLKELRQEEKKKVRQWGNAMQMIISVDENTELTLASGIIQSNTTIPVILTDADTNIIAHRNLNERRSGDEAWLQKKLAEMQREKEPIEVTFGGGQKNYIYYQNSVLLTQLRYYPVILLVVISIFVVTSYIAFSKARKSEQNQVWNGLAKETAHQIGTPLSSLMGWLELLKMKSGNEEMVEEMEKDLNRLNTITDRFSKIGSRPTLSKTEVSAVTGKTVEYLKSRSPGKITVSFSNHLEGEEELLINKQLYSWVIENLIRNATDAIEGKGEIEIKISKAKQGVYVDVCDTGRGIPANRYRSIFRPGYSTKKRGWGLGLSLARRIIEDYHHGRIFVLQSELDKGSTFRIWLKK